jgi:hypothetical protein
VTLCGVGPPTPVPGVGQGLKVPQIGAHGLSVASVSLVADDSRHPLLVILRTRDGRLFCPPFPVGKPEPEPEPECAVFYRTYSDECARQP